MINAIFYVVKTGCPWRSLPHDFPDWRTVYGYFHRWGADGTWELVNAWFVKKTWRHSGRKKRPTAGCLDSRTVNTTGVAPPGRGWGGGKRMTGRKRLILTNAQGLLPGVWVCAASVGEKAGAMGLPARLKERAYLRDLCGRLQLVWVGGGYRGAELMDWVRKLWGWMWEPVLRSAEAKDFVPLKRRWVVERTFAWFNHARRLSKDYEYNLQNYKIMIYIMSIRIVMSRF